MVTRAKKVKGGYSLTGSKMWISNSPIADVFVVWAKDDEGAIRGFVLEKSFKNLSAPAIHGKVGLRASITGEVVMDNVFCPEENAFPEVRGLKGPFTCLNSARYGIAWGALGAAEDCWFRARTYVLDRKQFGRPIGSYQAVSHRCAQMLLEVEGARSATYYAGWCADAEPETVPLAGSMAKAYASDAGWRVSASSLQVHGGIGFTWEHDLHFFLKRARVDGLLYGSAGELRDYVAGLSGLEAVQPAPA